MKSLKFLDLSKKEEKVVEWIVNIAKENGLKYVVDEALNVVVYVPATKGYENKEAVIIQNHTDMVCDKTPDKEFNFDEDSLDILVEDGWITADRTTLGADNGIGVAAALALITEKDVAHPPLELLFTSDEETGLNGAQSVDPSLFTAKRMLNLDTEEWGSLYIGCAGGVDYEFSSKLETMPASFKKAYKVVVSKLKGGHSGIDIHKSRGNASKILNEVVADMDFDFELVSFNGGKAHNIIPRDADCTLFTDSEDLLKEHIAKKKSELLKYLPVEDKNFDITVEEVEASDEVLKDKDHFISLVTLFPHGAYSYNWQSKEPLVNYSNNLAVVKVNGGELYIQTSLRFTDIEEMKDLENKLDSLAKLFNLKKHKGVGYPSWKPDFNNPLLDLVKNKFEEVFHKKAEVKAIHAGLECGLIKDKFVGSMDIVSFGPNITGAHSPTERIEIESTQKFGHFLLKYLRVYDRIIT